MVFGADEQSAQPVDTLRWVKLAEAVLAAEGVRGETEVSLLFVDETAIADLNSRFLGKDGPTDVLAFPIDEEPSDSGRSPDSGGTGPGFSGEAEEAPTLLGDVVICPAVAYRNAPEHAGSYEDEVALLVVHGLLHLLGLDHDEPDEAEAMEAKERDLLARYYQAGQGGGSTPAGGTTRADADGSAPAGGAARADGTTPADGSPSP